MSSFLLSGLKPNADQRNSLSNHNSKKETCNCHQVRKNACRSQLVCCDWLGHDTRALWINFQRKQNQRKKKMKLRLKREISDTCPVKMLHSIISDPFRLDATNATTFDYLYSNIGEEFRCILNTFFVSNSPDNSTPRSISFHSECANLHAIICPDFQSS